MEQNLLNNKDLAVNLCKSIELVYSAIGEINSVKVDDYEKLSEHFATSKQAQIQETLHLTLPYPMSLFLLPSFKN